jgi:hypothetical protein
MRLLFLPSREPEVKDTFPDKGASDSTNAIGNEQWDAALQTDRTRKMSIHVGVLIDVLDAWSKMAPGGSSRIIIRNLSRSPVSAGAPTHGVGSELDKELGGS